MKRILVIDDDEFFREMLHAMIEREGYEVDEAEDGEVGIEKHKKKQFDLIITDIIMPNKEGIGTIMELRSDYPDVKIIAVSGGGRVVPNSYLHIAEKLGAHKTMTKPFERKELISSIKELIGSC
ncbi:MAG: response regulator [Calditrichaeota bacterium]|nr:response regulator [Calditrichota bacterium]